MSCEKITSPNNATCWMKKRIQCIQQSTQCNFATVYMYGYFALDSERNMRCDYVVIYIMFNQILKISISIFAADFSNSRCLCRIQLSAYRNAIAFYINKKIEIANFTVKYKTAIAYCQNVNCHRNIAWLTGILELHIPHDRHCIEKYLCTTNRI